jgi:hypothetical protein
VILVVTLHSNSIMLQTHTIFFVLLSWSVSVRIWIGSDRIGSDPVCPILYPTPEKMLTMITLSFVTVLSSKWVSIFTIQFHYFCSFIIIIIYITLLVVKIIRSKFAISFINLINLFSLGACLELVTCYVLEYSEIYLFQLAPMCACV